MKNTNTTLIVIVIILVAGFLYYTNSNKEKTTINVNGQSTIKAEADEVSVYVGIETTEKTSEESKNATKRIAGILNEIQNMTNDSVILTEEATKLADSGLTLSKFAGETFEKLSDSIQNSSEAAYQISSSAIEQKTSMESLENSMKSFAF